jgi:ABC-type sugar transport system substrate-binding protein
MTGKRRGILALVVLGLVLGAAMAAVAGATTSGGVDGKKVAFVLWGNDPYQQAQGAWFKTSAEADGAKVTLINGKTDPVTQAKAVSDLVAGGYAGIAWQPVDAKAAINPARQIRAAEIPLVYVGARPDDPSVTAPFIKFSDAKTLLQAGKDAGKYVKANMPGGVPKVVIFDVMNLPLCHQERMTSFVNGLKSVVPGTKIVYWDNAGLDRASTLAKMENLLQKNTDFNVFTGCGGDLIMGGVAGLQAAGRAKAVNKKPTSEWILAIDGTPEMIDLHLRKDSSVMEDVTLTPKENGEATWRVLKSIMQGKTKPDSGQIVNAPSIILPSDCKKQALVFTREYRLVKEFKVPNCSKYAK